MSATLLERSRLLGPAFVAAVAYVDPGNVATNTSAGARYGYLLLWVPVAATLMAGLVQYLSAKAGWLTGASLPSLVATRTGRRVRLAYWAQAELVALATDVAEIVGGAVALSLLFGLPLVVGAVITTVVSTALLFVQNRRSQRAFERVITGLLAVVTLGFLAGLVFSPPDPGAAVAGLLPRLAGVDSVVLAVGMLGATIMPHAVYLHSALVRDRHGLVDAAPCRAGVEGHPVGCGAGHDRCRDGECRHAAGGGEHAVRAGYRGPGRRACSHRSAPGQGRGACSSPSGCWPRAWPRRRSAATPAR